MAIWRRTLVVLTGLALLAVGALPADAVGTLDASNTDMPELGKLVGGAKYAQTFTAGAAGNLVQIDLPLAKSTPTGNLTVEIWATSSGRPSGGPLATMTLTPAQVATEVAWISIAVTPPVPSVAGTQYAIVLVPPNDDDFTVNHYLAGGNVEGTYTGGEVFGSVDGGTTWLTSMEFGSETSQDLAFKTYVTPTCQTLPAYTPGAVNLSSGSWCITNAYIGGSLTIGPGVAVTMTGSTVKGTLNANAPAALTICASTINGTTTVADAAGAVLVGPTGTCTAASSLVGRVTITRGHGEVRVQDGYLPGGLVLTNNTGGAAHVVKSNYVAGVLQCSGNVAPATNGGGPNAGKAARAGECAVPGF
jgi:hypothetical protein